MNLCCMYVCMYLYVVQKVKSSFPAFNSKVQAFPCSLADAVCQQESQDFIPLIYLLKYVCLFVFFTNVQCIEVLWATFIYDVYTLCYILHVLSRGILCVTSLLGFRLLWQLWNVKNQYGILFIALFFIAICNTYENVTFYS